MIDIFEQLNLLLTEAETEGSKNTKKPLPIHPEMSTKEQGEMAAAEKILKLFQKLQMGNTGSETVNDGLPQIPDDLIDPMFKTPPKSSKDKTFDKNKLSDWDDDIEDEDKVKKDIETVDGPEDDDFDDFDYRNNEFGDDDDDDDSQEQDDRSEEEKLKDSIKDALDSIDDGNSGGQGQGQENDDSGANWEDGDDGRDGGSGQQKQQRNARGKRLEDLRNALESEDMDKFNSDLEGIKDIIDTPDEKGATQPGGKMETPSDEDVKNDMKDAGMDRGSIEKTLKEKNVDTTKDYSEEEIEEMTQQVIDGLEKSCKGRSSLADTIATAAASRKIKDEDWKEILKLFLDKKSIAKGNTSSSNDEIAFGNKHSLWRGAVLPKMDAPSKGNIQTITCFVDFSGSVNKNLVFHFLGEVVNLCIKLKYSSVQVYGFSDYLSVPKTIDKKSLMEDSNDLDEAIKTTIAETWDFMNKQNLGGAEQFKNVAEEINKIKRNESDSVFLIFGDAEWASIRNLKDYINRTRYFKDTCILVYYIGKPCKEFIKTVDLIKNYVGVDHLITSKAESIR